MPNFKTALTLTVVSGFGCLVNLGCTHPSTIDANSSPSSNKSILQLLGITTSERIESNTAKKQLGQYSLQKGNTLLVDSINQTNDALIEQYIRNPYSHNMNAVVVVSAVAESTNNINSSEDSFSKLT